VYNYRIFDRHNHFVVSLAILSDTNPDWRPNQFGYELWGCNVGIKFPVVKLLDYRDQWDKLEENQSPFAVVVMAHLKTQETRNNYDKRKAWKFYLAKRLFERGYKRDDVVKLLKFIDWIMRLPKNLEKIFWQELNQYDKEGKYMPYVMSIERIAMERGMKKGIEQGIEKGEQQGIRQMLLDALEAKFEIIPEKLLEKINNITDKNILIILHRNVIKCNSLKEFEENLNQF